MITSEIQEYSIATRLVGDGTAQGGRAVQLISLPRAITAKGSLQLTFRQKLQLVEDICRAERAGSNRE